MLCSAHSATTTMQYDRSACDAAGPSNVCGSAGSGRSTPTKQASPRMRHHVRSFSGDAGSFTTSPRPSRSPSSMPSNSLPRRHDHQANGKLASPPSGAAEPARKVSAPTPSPSPSSKADVSSSFAESSSTSSSGASTSASSALSSVSSSTNGGSPPQRASPARASVMLKTPEETAEEAALEKLRSAQANRRPKMMRLTPAHSSLPARSFSKATSGAASKASSSAQQQAEDAKLAFPAKGTQAAEQSTAPLHPQSRKAIALKASTPPLDSPGLQLDLRYLPSPSEMLNGSGSVTTSRLPDHQVRDRRGNPIKSSLKSPSVASAFMSHRADSTPALPMNYRSAKSVPTTPTAAKAVHFDSQLEHVKIFKFKQKPAAVSRDGSPEHTETETEEEKDTVFPYVYGRPDPSNDPSPSSRPADVEEQLVLRLPNFPSSTRLSVDREIFLERIFLADDLRSVKGTVQVKNIAFEKWVAVRFTLDKWATVNEVTAEHAESIKGGTADRFTFSIKLNELLDWPRGAAGETKSMFMCLRYTSTAGEFWDNNEGLNYQLDFRKRQAPATPASTPAALMNSPGVQRNPPRAYVAPSISQGSAKARILEMARRGVHANNGGFAMEDLRRELDRLKSDEEEEDRAEAAASDRAQQILSEAALAASQEGTSSPQYAKAKLRQSPPVSPGHRSGSPSMWTARYDFGQSLRNPKAGSRTTGMGRAAALDYFSSKPSPRPSSSAASSQVSATPTPTQAGFVVSVASPGGGISSTSTPGQDSPDFAHRFGMISPGLEHHVEHRPFISAASPSPVDSLSVPTPTETFSISGRTQPAQASHERFYSLPHIRSSHSNPRSIVPVSRTFFEDGAGPGRSSLMGSPLLGSPRTPSPPGGALSPSSDPRLLAMDECGSPMSSNASPISPGSPNPFSNSVSTSSTSICSAGSDTTLSPETPLDHAVLRGNAILLSGLRDRSNTLGSNSPRSSTGTLTPETSVVDGERYRPASMSDMEELVARYCFSTDVVPSGGSLIPTAGTDAGPGGLASMLDGGSFHRATSPLASGATTPTPRF